MPPLRPGFRGVQPTRTSDPGGLFVDSIVFRSVVKYIMSATCATPRRPKPTLPPGLWSFRALELQNRRQVRLVKANV